MTELEAILRCNANLNCHYADRIKTAFGFLYYCDDNKELISANHAVITDFSDPMGALEAIKAFYTQKAVVPRISSDGTPGSLMALAPALSAGGWSVTPCGLQLMVYRGGVSESSSGLEVCVFARPEAQICEMISAFDGGEWNVKALHRRLEYGSTELFAGFCDGVPCCSATLCYDFGTNMALICNVFTLPKYRGRGFARTLISAVLRHFEKMHPGAGVHLWTENMTAVRVYSDCGMVLSPKKPELWYAFTELSVPFDDM